jgi:hypothetical protein
MNGLLNLLKLIRGEGKEHPRELRPRNMASLRVHTNSFASGEAPLRCYSSHPRKQRSTLTAASAAF